MQQELKTFISKYRTGLKMGLLIGAGFWMIIAIQTYNNYLTIIENTSLVENQAQKVLDEISYFNHFQLKYLNSDHAQRFLAHENNILTPGEAIISFQEPTSTTMQTGENTILDQKKTPLQEREAFFSQKLN